MPYNKARAEKEWLKWKNDEEQQLRELGVDEDIIQRLHKYDWDVFKSDRRFYEKLADINEYVDVCFSKETLDNVRTTEDLLNCIEDEHLLIILERSDRITLEIVALKMQGYAPKEIAKQLKMTRDAVNRRLVRLRKKFFKDFKIMRPY